MKRTLLASASILLSLGAMAQLPVSTTPSNKNVVLEEFTGIYCVYCPDGHLRAEQLRAANPNDVFLVNIHTGSYAAPGAGDPDFRTTFGAAIAGQSGLTGYPAGTINRHLFPGMQQGSGTAMSRGDWATAGGQILTEASYVNVALEADIDVATRVMTVDLEAYFTANGASSMNINVAVTQNNIEGPQTGGSSYNPGQVLPNGNYNHGHMLRHMITGQWGDVVTTTTSGTTVTKQYTWTIPTDINGIPVEIGELQVIGFIVEGQQEIITGAEGPVTYTVPAGTVLVDLQTQNQTSTPADYCVSTITPKVYVTNNETNACSGYEVSYSIDGGAPVSQTITTPLAGGASVSHTFPAAAISGGTHSISYDISPTSSTELELVTGNNTSDSPSFLTISSSVSATPKSEDFESVGSTEMPTGAYTDGDLSNFFTVDISYLSTSSTQPVGGFGQSANSLWFYFWNNSAGKVGSVFFDKIDLVGKESASITFDHAFTTWQGTNDKLEIFVSEDCGSSWTSVWVKTGADLKTAPEINQNNSFFIPGNDDWVANTVNLDNYVGKEIMVKFTGTSDFGDCLYVDNINISGVTTGVEELFSSDLVRTFPNPANNNVTVAIESVKAANVTISVIDVVGKVVFAQQNTAINKGENQINISTTNLESGVYFVTISENGLSTTKRIVVQH